MKKILLSTLFLFASCSSHPVRIQTRHSSDPGPVQIPTKGKGSQKVGASANSAPSTAAPVETGSGGAEALRLEKEGNYLAALKEFVCLSVSSHSSKQSQEYYRLKALEIADNKLSEDELDKVSSDSDYGFIRGHALFKLGELSMQRRDTSTARRYFSSVLSFLPESDIAARAQDYISQIDSVRYVEPKTIGVILPLSGKNGPIAQKTLRAVEMGLGLESSDSRFKLAVMDSEGNPDNARRSVERLVKEDNVIAIIGSLLSKTASAEVSKADELGVPSLVLSQKSGITDVGPSVFRNSLTSEMQVHHLVHVAMDELGMKRFAILFPNDPYGTEYANIFWDEVLARGGTIAAAQTYNSKDTDFRGPVERLVGTYYIEARLDEYKTRMKETKANQKGKVSRQEKSSDDVLPPITDFDAIFIPDSAKTLGQLAAFLSYGGVRGIKLLGTNLWNSPGLAKRAGNFSSNLLFVDGVFNQSDSYQHSSFVQEYKKMFNEDPSLLEIQAYDSALILRQTILGGATTRDELSRRLSELRKFPGSLGPLDMSKNREVLRPILSLTVAHDGQIIPAAKTATP
jgi:branched-chain amino acid transport system substrate-binding protein